jgi:glycosyltransferase involved in cell wall biosynthesis
VTRVLHVLGRLDFGGVEAWLAGVAGSVDRRKVELDFLVHDPRPGALDGEVRAHGCRILPCPIAEPLAYPGRFRRILREQGPYDVVHSHVHHFSGVVLALARAAGVPIRIAHSHSDTRGGDAAAGRRRRAYLGVAGWLLRRNATVEVAASKTAAQALFGAGWESDPRVRVVHCGIDLARYAGAPPRAEVRRELGIPPDAVVLGHVGRLSPPKNHAFLVKVMAAAARGEPRARLLAVGGGPLEGALRRAVAAYGLQDRVVLPGARTDVPRLLAAMDAFVFPSLWEGMPLSLVEAQAAGLPCLVSTAVTDEATVVGELVTRRDLAVGAEPWAATALHLARSPRPVEPAAALARVRESDFDVGVSARALEGLYGAA